MINPAAEFSFDALPSVDADTAEFSLVIPATLSYLAGHFPGEPIVPAVAIIDACVELRRKLSPEPGPWRLAETLSAKFTQPIRPEQKIQIIAKRMDAGQEQWKFQWKIVTEEAAVLAVDLLLAFHRVL